MTLASEEKVNGTTLISTRMMTSLLTAMNSPSFVPDPLARDRPSSNAHRNKGRLFIAVCIGAHPFRSRNMMKPLTTITTRRVARFCGDNIELLGLATLALILVTVPEAAYAAGGVNRVNAFMDNIGSMLRAASVSVVTVA